MFRGVKVKMNWRHKREISNEDVLLGIILTWICSFCLGLSLGGIK